MSVLIVIAYGAIHLETFLKNYYVERTPLEEIEVTSTHRPIPGPCDHLKKIGMAQQHMDCYMARRTIARR
jgi:hypothetical protein